jgi:hypothetical protein
MRPPAVAAGFGIVALALAQGWIVSLATTRVVNWFVMTDELHYIRLAISVAQTGSPLPRLHGEIVANVNQLYPVVISGVFGNGDVGASLVAAHRLNAFVMTSAAIPVFLLARHTGVGRLASVWIGALAAAVPWVVLSSFLLTESIAYPAFCWALLAITAATARSSWLLDLVALLAIAVAVLARAQFVVLALVLAAAVLAEAVLREAAAPERRGAPTRAAAMLVRTRKLLIGAYLVGVVILAVAAFGGGASRLLGSYAVTAQDVRVDVDLMRSAAEHLAILSLGIAILPFVLGAAWLVDRLRASAPARERALASVGCATVLLLTLQIASFDQRFGAGLVKDRYLFYALPVVLVALAAGASSGSWPRWWTYVVPTLVCAIGFSTVALPVYEKLNVDSPLAILNDEILRLAGSPTWANALLALATMIAGGLLVEAAVLFPRRVVAVGVAVVATIAMPAQTVYAFDRLFAVDGTNGLPITLDQSGVFGWIDRELGAAARVTMMRYPVNAADYWAGIAYWWDVEFWNESVVDEFDPAGGSAAPEPWSEAFDGRTGSMPDPGTTRYVLVHKSDARFRIAGTQVLYERDAYVVETEQPWRAAWVTDGIYGDGWTRPHTPARIKVFAEPGQRSPLVRFLTLSITQPDPAEARPLTITSNLERWGGTIPPGGVLDRLTRVCVPPAGHATLEVETPIVSDVYRDPSRGALTGEVDRPAGVLLRSIALADEKEPRERCPAAAAR